MLWLAWRQHRVQVLVTAALVAGVGAVLLLDRLPTDLLKALPWSPVLIGLFWGVPLLAKEFEHGTHRLVWTQSVRRWPWLAVKLAGLGVAVSLAGLALGALVTRWTAIADTPVDRFSGDLFGVTGVAPAAWFLAAFALGTAAGAVLRRVLPAMAVTIAVFAVLVVGAFLGRPYYAEPVVAMQTSAGIAVPAGALVAETGVENAAGERMSWDEAWAECEPVEPVSCLAERGYDRQYTAYHPADRYWRFQWIEAVLLLLVTAVCTAVTVALVVRRRA